MTLLSLLCDSKCNGKKEKRKKEKQCVYPTIILSTTREMEQIEKNTGLKPSIFLKYFTMWLSFPRKFFLYYKENLKIAPLYYILLFQIVIRIQTQASQLV